MANKPVQDLPFGLMAPIDKFLIGVKEQIPGEVSNIQNLLNVVEEVTQPDILKGVTGDAFKKIKLRTETDAPRTEGGPTFKRYICRQPEMDACIPFNGEVFGVPTNFNEVKDDHYFIEMHGDGGKLDLIRTHGKDDNIQDGQIVRGGYGHLDNMSSPFISVATAFSATPAGNGQFTAGNGSRAFGDPGNPVSNVANINAAGNLNPQDCKKNPQANANIFAGTPAYASKLFAEADKLLNFKARHCWGWVQLVHVHACLHGNFPGRGFNKGGSKSWANTNSKGVYVGRGTRNPQEIFAGNWIGRLSKKYTNKRRYPHQFMPKTDRYFNLIKPGDWIQYWNGNSSPLQGHSVLFKKWIDKPKRIAQVYSQMSPSKGGKLHNVDFKKKRASIFKIQRF